MRALAAVLGVTTLACGGSGAAVVGGSSTSGTSGEASTSTSSATTSDTSSSHTSSSEAESSSSPADTSTATADSSDSSSTAAINESSSSDSTGGAIPIPCPAGVLGPAVPSTLVGTTVGQIDELVGPCGGNGAPDIAYEFTAQADGRFAFDTFGAELDTIVYVQDAMCGGEPLACNDDGIDDASVVYVDLAEAQTVVVVVDGLALAPGDFVLSVRDGDVECPRDDLGGGVPKVVTDNTAIGFDEFDPTCGSFDSRDLAFTFTAPSDGEYTFDTFGSSFDTILAVLDGACEGAELACNHNAIGSNDGASGVVVPLAEGQTVTAVVEGVFGAKGEIQLGLGRLGGICPDATIDDALPTVFADELDAADNTTQGSCGGAFGGDDLLAFTAAIDGYYMLSTAGSGIDTVIYVRDGGCNGPELGCNDDATFDDVDSALVVPLVAAQSVIIAIDADGPGGAYSLALDVVPCVGETLAATVPQSVDGSTQGAANVRAGSCGGIAAPEIAYAFTAPIAGTYTFDTVGSELDTVVYVRDGTACEGIELGCNDDAVGLASQVQVDLAADQTVTVVVDGHSTNFGSFTLGIDG